MLKSNVDIDWSDYREEMVSSTDGFKEIRHYDDKGRLIHFINTNGAELINVYLNDDSDELKSQTKYFKSNLVTN